MLLTCRTGVENMRETYDLERFIRAQKSIYPQALAELRSGSKRSHWMWFIFPQIHGLGSSPMAVEFAISGLEEARAYLAHPVLGARLREATEAVLAVEGRSASEIFGYPDDLKFHSSMTLFASVEGEGIFARALRKYFDGAM